MLKTVTETGKKSVTVELLYNKRRAPIGKAAQMEQVRWWEFNEALGLKIFHDLQVVRGFEEDRAVRRHIALMYSRASGIGEFCEEQCARPTPRGQWHAFVAEF